MQRYFDEHYDLLKQRLDEMAQCVQQSIAWAIEALATGNAELAQKTIDADTEIDRHEVELDELVIRLLALQQPIAIDLRFVITVLKINNDLERMGDQAVNIAQTVIRMAERCETGRFIDFGPMEDVVQDMVRGCIDAFNRGDTALAREVRLRDDEVDAMNRDNIARASAHAHAHPDDADLCMSLLLISRNIERIGDLSTNIAEDAVYYIEGKIIKHTSAQGADAAGSG